MLSLGEYSDAQVDYNKNMVFKEFLIPHYHNKVLLGLLLV
jgi:hypothetical protein